MGKCLSACSDPNPAEQNGGPKRTEQIHYPPPMTTVPSHPPPPQPIRETSLSSIPSSGPEYYFNGTHTRIDKNKMAPGRKINGVDTGSRTRPPKTECSDSKINRLFDHYKDEEDCILAEGMEKFCVDLDVDPTEFIVLVLAWKFQAVTMCQFTRKEFFCGCKSLKVDSIKGIQGKFPDMLDEVIEEEAKFKDLYRFTFTFGLDMDGGQRSLPCDIAIPLWTLVFKNREPAILERWVNFLQENQVRGISKDTWNMFLNFTEVVGVDFSGYDDSEAWPSLFDDFVEYELEKEKAMKNGYPKRTDDRNTSGYYN